MKKVFVRNKEKIQKNKPNKDDAKLAPDYENISEEELDRYKNKLARGEMRLRDVPSVLLESPYTRTLHVCAFRASRRSIIFYDSDLCFVREEIMYAKEKKNWSLVKVLDHIYEQYLIERSWGING